MGRSRFTRLQMIALKNRVNSYVCNVGFTVIMLNTKTFVTANTDILFITILNNLVMWKINIIFVYKISTN